MCLLSQSFLPLLLALPGRLFLSTERLASLPHRSLNALLRFRFRRGSRDALLYGVVVLDDPDHDVAGAALIPERAAHGSRAQSLPARAFVHETARNEEVIDVERCARVLGLALRVGNSAAQHFLDVACRALLGEAQNLQGVLGALPPDQVHHQADLLGRHAHVPRHRYRFNRRSLYRFVCHELGSLRRRRRAASGRCRASRGRAWRSRCSRSAGNTRRPLECGLYSVALKRARRRELAKFVSNHLFGDVHRNKFSAVVHGNRVADHVGKNRRTARPRLDDFLFVARVHSLHLYTQVVIDERTFFKRACHRFSVLLIDSSTSISICASRTYSSTRRSLIHCARRILRNPRTGPGTRCESGQNGHTNRVPCAFGVFSTATAHPGLHNRYCTCKGGAATNRPAGSVGFAGRAGRADLRARVTRRAVERVRLLLVALIVFLSMPAAPG